MRSTSRLLCGLLVFCVTLYCESFNALVEAHARPISRQRAAKLDVRNSLKRWDRPFGAVLRGAEAVGYHNDGQLSTRQLTDTAAQVTDSYTYDAFGVTLAQTGSTANNYLYTGEQLDPNVGLYYLRARYLNLNIGRFISTDPHPSVDRDPISLHKYAYAQIQPVTNSDPSGEIALLALIQAAVLVGILAYVVAKATGFSISEAFHIGLIAAVFTFAAASLLALATSSVVVVSGGVGASATGQFTYVVNTATGSLSIGSSIHPVLAEIAGFGVTNAGILVGGFITLSKGRLVSFDLSSGTYPGTAQTIDLATRVMNALIGSRLVGR